MPSTGFRAKKRCIGQAVNEIYTVPANTTASASITVLAPSGAKVFVQNSAVPQLKFSTAQTYSVENFTLSKPLVPTSLMNEARTTVSQFCLYSRTCVALDETMAASTYNRHRGYIWQYRTGDAMTLQTPVDTSNSDWITLGGSYHSTSSSGFSYDKGANEINSNNQNVQGYIHHDFLDIRANPLFSQAKGVCTRVNEFHFLSTHEDNTNISDTGSRLNHGIDGVIRRTERGGYTSKNQLYYNSGYTNYTTNPSYGDTGGVLYGDPEQPANGIMIRGSNGYLSSYRQTLSSIGGNSGFTNMTTDSDNWVYQTISGSSLVNRTAYWCCADVMFDGTKDSNQSWYYVMFINTSDNNSISLARKHTDEMWNVQTSVERTYDIIDPGESGWYPLWCIQLNGYYYLAIQKNASAGTKDTGDNQKLYRTSGTFTGGTWSEVTDYPDYVDLLPKPIIISDDTMLFAKWGDETNSQMLNNVVDVDDSNTSTYYTGTDVDFGEKGVASLKVGSTDTWTEDFQDLTELVPFVSPNQAVTDVASDDGLTFTKMREVGSTSLYDFALHTSDTSFRNVLSTFPDRDDDSDLTDTLNSSFERTNLVLTAGDRVYVYTNSDETIVQIYGYEDS